MSSSIEQLSLPTSLVRALNYDCFAFDNDETASAADFVSKVLFRLLFDSNLSSVTFKISHRFS